MEEENQRDVVRPYVVDGIQEYDNPLPPWWVWMFNLCIVFGVGYMIWFHWFGWNQLDEQLQKDRVTQVEFIKAHTMVGPGDLSERLKDPKVTAEGKVVFTANCAPCHGNLGQGVVGPNLTDRFWLHGGAAADIAKLISNGVPEKGMLSWGPILGVQKIESLTSFILSIQGSNPAAAKEAQGEEYKP